MNMVVDDQQHIKTGWWLTYPSEKYESVGMINYSQSIYLSNQINLSIYLYISLSLYIYIYQYMYVLCANLCKYTLQISAAASQPVTRRAHDFPSFRSKVSQRSQLGPCRPKGYLSWLTPLTIDIPKTIEKTMENHHFE